MIKIYCDSCEKLINHDEEGFACEISTKTIITDMASHLPMPQKKMTQQGYQICKDCYKKTIGKKLNAKEEKKSK